MALDPEVQRSLESIMDEIRELTSVMRGLGRTMSALGDDEIKAFSRSTKVANTSVQKVGKSAKQAALTIDAYSKVQKEATKTTEAAADAAHRAAQASEELAAAQRRRTAEEFVYRRTQRSAFRDLAEEFSTTRGATARLQEGLFGTMQSSQGLQAATLLLEAGFRGLSKATLGLAASIYQGARGAQVSAQAFSSLAKEVGTAAQGVGLALGAFSLLGVFVPKLMLFGIAIGVLRKGFAALGGVLALFGITVKAAAEINEAAAKQNDQLFKGFNDLSRAGIGAAGGLDGLFDSLQRAGMSVAEIEQFTSLLATNSRQLTFLGTTTGEAARRFADLAGGLRKSQLGEELEMLGIQAEEQRELVMSYMTQQARLGRLENRSRQQLIQSSAQFARELDLMAQLTGASRKEQMEIRERQMADERFRSAIAAAKARGDQAELARLEKAKALAAAVEAAGDKAGATGILQIAAGRGALTTPEAVAAEMTYGVNAVLNSQASVTDSLKMMVEQGKISQAQMADVNALIGTVAGIQTPVADLADVLDRLGPAIEKANLMGMPLEEYLRNEAKLREQGDKALEQNVQAGRMQQNAAQIMDSVMRTFNYSATVHQTASSVFQSAVNKFAETVGAQGVAGGQITTGGRAPGYGGAGGDGGEGGGESAFGPQGAPHTRAARAVMGLFLGGQDSKYAARKDTVSPESVLAFMGGFSGNRANYERLAPEFRDRINQMAQEYLQYTGQKMPFQSGFRSQEENMAVGGAPTSLHLQGRAADLGRETVATLDRLGLLDRYGFKMGRSGSHVSDTGKKMGGISRGPSSGYMELLHGTEAVVPLPDGKTIPVSLSGPMDRFISRLAEIDIPTPQPAPRLAESRAVDTAPRQQIDMMAAQLSRLDEVVAVMRNQLGVSQRILQVSQN